jgi:hypothetical protein
MVTALKKETIEIGSPDFRVWVDVYKLLPDLSLKLKQKFYLAEAVYSYEPGRALGVFESAEDACQSCLRAAIEGYSPDI